MGNGEATKLSPLQKQILVLALRNKEREGRGFDWKAGGPDVFYSEIMAEIYHFPLRKDYGGRGPREMPANRIFAPKQIGEKRYRAAKSAISRSVLRLHRRDLAISIESARSTWSGCILTPSGVVAARRLQAVISA
jgi:hypothetical protein